MSTLPRAFRIAKPRILAELPRQGHAVIEASAGTGKTYTIESLVVDLLLDEQADLRLDQLLVVTFTTKATTELKERVRKKIDALLMAAASDVTEDQAGDTPHWLVDDTGRQRLERALLAFDSANISTIHSFCQRVLVEHAFAGQRLFTQEQVDGRAVFHAAFLGALRRELSRDEALAPWLEAALAEGWTVEALEELLWDCHRTHSPIRPVLDEEALRAAAERLAKLELPDEDEIVAAGLGTSLAKLAPALAAIEVAVRGDGPSVPALLLLGKQTEYVVGLKTFAKKFPDGHEAIGALRAASVSFAAALAQRFLPPVRERLEQRKREAGQFDFDDMIRLVRDSLADAVHGPALAQRLGERFRVALIDEFQDTDETQWEIFRRIFVEREGSGNRLFVVGDPKQAIYGFRGADVAVYRAACRELLGGESPARLPENFRSTEAMIAAYNRVLEWERGESAPYFTGTNEYPEPVRCGRPGKLVATQRGEPVVPIRLMELRPDGRRLPAAMARRQLTSYIAAEIRRLLDEKQGLRFGDAGDEKLIEPSDIYVLTRSAKDGYAVGAALREAGVPHAYYKQDGLFATDQAADVLTLLRAVCDPDDRELRMKAWLTPFFAVPLAELPRCDELAGTTELARRLRRWKRLADRRRHHELFASLVDESGLVVREVFLGEGERALTNYLHLLELLLEEATATGCSLRELAHWLRARIAESDEESSGDGSDDDVQRIESERQAVQIMSMHKSKGLEAAVVFLYGGFGRRPTRDEDVSAYHDERRRAAWVGNPDGEVKKRLGQERDEEDQRLFYVAMTRAKALLYLPYLPELDENLKRDPRSDADGFIRGDYKPLHDRLRALAPQLDTPSLRSLIAVHDPPRERRHEGSEAAPSPTTWKLPAPIAIADDARHFEALRERHAGYAMESYSSLKRNQAKLGQRGARHGGERATVEARPLGDDSLGPLPGGKDTGNSLHRAIEKLRFETLAEAGDFDAWRKLHEVRALFRSCLARHGLDEQHLREAQRLVYATLTARLTLDDGRGYQTTLDGLGRLARRLCELPFTYPIPEAQHPRLDRALQAAAAGGEAAFVIERGYLQGAIDFVFEHEGRCFLLDWKSDTLASYGQAALTAHVAAHYAIQEQLYTLAVVKLLGVRDEASYEARFGGIVYCFLRGVEAGGGVWFRRPTWDEVLAWERELRETELPRSPGEVIDEGEDPEAGLAEPEYDEDLGDEDAGEAAPGEVL